MGKNIPFDDPNNNEEENAEKKAAKQYEKTVNLPAKDHLDKLDEMILNLQEDLSIDSVNLKDLRRDLDILNKNCCETLDNITSDTLSMLYNLTKEFRETSKNNLFQTDSLINEFRHLNNEVEKLQFDVDTLDIRTHDFENNMGYLELIEKIKQEKSKKRIY